MTIIDEVIILNIQTGPTEVEVNIVKVVLTSKPNSEDILTVCRYIKELAVTSIVRLHATSRMNNLLKGCKLLLLSTGTFFL